MTNTVSMHGMYIHLDPKTGVVEPYSNEIQDVLKMQNVPSDNSLGPKCFHATVHLRPEGSHYQTTPPVTGPRGEGKPSGYRQVRRITARLLSDLYKIHTLHGWRFSSDGGVPVSIDCPINRVATWQWCTQTSYTPDNDKWVCYESNVNDDLEEAWTNGGHDNFELIIPVGISNKKIIVDRTSALFRQHDTVTPRNQRWVRRILMELADVQKIRNASIDNCPDDVCAICICSYEEASMAPRRSLPCSHTFHCACLAPINDKRCPLCRAPFT